MKTPRFIQVSLLIITSIALVSCASFPCAHKKTCEAELTADLPRDVQVQFMRPAQLEAAAREFPVIYVPFGLIEWHGQHLPLGKRVKGFVQHRASPG